jgi:demethylmenaquinone methyltransferase/2-methoxy-6-polyprenyl-1,4-benzoquinol methylase
MTENKIMTSGKPSKPRDRSDDDPAQKIKDERVFFGYRQVRADEKAQLVLQHFDSIARKYDVVNTLLSLGLHLIWKRSAVEMLELRQGDMVVDVCGGTADLSIYAAKAVGPAGRVILYDINRAMIEAGLWKASRKAKNGIIKFVQGDAERISLSDGLFDAAMVGFGVRNLTHMEKGFEEMYRLLKPGGKLLCLEFSMPTAAMLRWLYNLYSFRIMPLAGQLLTGSRVAYTYLPESIRVFPLPKALVDILKKIGFSMVTYKKFTNGIAVVHLGVKS